MDNLEFAEDGSGIVGENHLLQMVDDNLVAAIRSKGCLHSAGDLAASVDVANDSAILCVVATGICQSVLALVGGWLVCSSRAERRSLLLVAGLEQAGVRCTGDSERHADLLCVQLTVVIGTRSDVHSRQNF